MDFNKLEDIINFAHNNNEKAGFNDDWKNTPEQILTKLFLIHSEVTEAGEEVRDGRMDIWYKMINQRGFL